MKKGFFKLLIVVMIPAFVLGTLGAAKTEDTAEPTAENAQSQETKASEEPEAKTEDTDDGLANKTEAKFDEDTRAADKADKTTDDADDKTKEAEDKSSGEIKNEDDKKTEDYPAPYTMAWLDKYAPASVAPFEEQVGDNGEYPEEVIRPDSDTYELVVDYTNQCVYAFSKDEDGERQLERVMICTTGGNGNWTPEGEYEMHSDYQRFGRFVSFGTYAQYWSQMWGNFYFHSIIYNDRDASTYTMSSYNNLGTPGSHGCIRLLVPDARWIYENCAPGTKCTVTTDYKKNPALKKALRNGYEGATDYVAPEEDTEEQES